MATKPSKRPISSPTLARSPKKSGSNAGLIIILLLILAIGGGGYYYYDMMEKERIRMEKAEAARRKAAEERARKAREEAERIAREKAEQERLKAEEEARRKAEEEARRKTEEEARRRAEEEECLRREQEQQDEETDETPEEPEQPEEPEKGDYDESVDLTGTLSREEREKFNAMLENVLKEGNYAEFSKAFTAKTVEAVQGLLGGSTGKLNYHSYRSSRNLMNAVELCILINYSGQESLRYITHPEDKLGSKPLKGSSPESGRDFIRWLVNDRSRPLHAFIQNYMLQEGRPENMPFSIQTFYNIWLNTPEKDRAKYLNLAIACSLVNPGTANSNGRLRNPKTPVLKMPEVFEYYRQRDSKRKLLTDVKKMSVARLLMVVDVRLPRSEFEWVEKNLSYDRASWASKAYNSIKYLMDRAKNGKDPYTHYTFEEIRKEGGICMDQAYYSANTAKVAGIPAVYAVGDGDRGGHAWVVSNDSETQWNQINSYGYKTGTYTNPCSGRRHHESMLLLQTKKEKPGQYDGAADCIGLSRFLLSNGNVDEARGAARYVTGAYPTLTAAWSNLVEMLGQEGGSEVDMGEWRRIHNTLSTQSRKNTELTDIAADVEDKYIISGRSAAGKKQAMDRSLRQLRRNGGEDRSDLVVEAIGRQASMLAENSDVRSLYGLYRKELKGYTKRGDVFGQLLSQCVSNYEKAEATPRDWAQLAKEAEKLFEKEIRSGGGDYFKLSKEVSIQKQVADIYAKAGNSKKAEKIAKEANERLSNAKKSD